MCGWLDHVCSFQFNIIFALTSGTIRASSSEVTRHSYANTHTHTRARSWQFPCTLTICEIPCVFLCLTFAPYFMRHDAQGPGSLVNNTALICASSATLHTHTHTHADPFYQSEYSCAYFIGIYRLHTPWPVGLAELRRVVREFCV